MPEKLGPNFDDEMLKSPLTVGRGRNEPGPQPNNVPVAKPDDPLGLIPGNVPRGRTSTNRRGGRRLED